MFTNPHKFVQRTFTPTIGCISSPNVEKICQKNNLSFVEMLRPFCSLNLDHRLRDPSGNDHLIKNLQICIQNINDIPPPSSLAKKFLNDSVGSAPCEVKKVMVVNNRTFDIPTDCKWFHAWSKTFLLVQYPSDHEFTKHLLGCLLVTSTTDPPETLQLLLQSLQQMQAAAPSKLPKWFSSNIFKFYVLVHDVRDGDRDKALKFFESLKSAYGLEYCFFLEINSQYQQGPSSVIHDYWMQYIFNRNPEQDGSDHGSSPRTPAEMIVLGGMSNNVPDTENIKSNVSVEVAQDAVEMQQSVVIHPLSPDIEMAPANNLSGNESGNMNVQKYVNADVWSDIKNNGIQHGNFLTPQDVGNIKNLIKHLVVQALIPYVEKQIFFLNEMTLNKKGVSRSLLTATKRLFGTSKSGLSSPSVNSVVYAFDAPELQLRRLGDLYFMFTNYALAFQAYHSVKRDFAADQAYLYLAGALEMTALSAFMQGDTSRKILDYMEEAILTYLNSCKLPQFATRATLFSTQFLKERQMFGEAAKQLIRMTSEDSDLRSALLLEQASYCFLHSTKPYMYRKYAFHMVLAGHRFSKAGQRKHALRCYKQAFQVYQDKGWSLAEDHIHFTMGRLAGYLKLLKEGSDSLSALLSSGNKQTPVQQITYLKEYLQMLQQLSIEESEGELICLPLPKIGDNSTSVLVSASPTSNLFHAFQPDSPADAMRWAKMEEIAVSESQGTPMIFRPTLHLFDNNTKNIVNPIAVVKENIHVQVILKNPLQITLPLLRVKLLWKFTKSDGEALSNEIGNGDYNSYVVTNELESINLDPYSFRKVVLTIKPLCPGQFDILGMYYVLSCPAENMSQNADVPEVQGKQLFTVRGPRIKPRKEKTDVLYEKDNRLQIRIIEALPLLQVDMRDFKEEMLSGQVEKVSVTLKNIGNAPLKNLYLVTCCSKLLLVSNDYVISEKICSDAAADGAHEYCGFLKEKNNTYKIMKIVLPNSILSESEDISLPLWIRAPDSEGLMNLKILFYYESLTETGVQRHRITRFSRDITVHASLQLNAIVSRSNLCEDRETMNVAMTVKKITDRFQLGELSVDLVQISLATTKWELHQNAIYSKDVRLKGQESYSFVVRAIRTTDGGKEVTDVCLQDKSVEPGSAHPFYDFYKWHLHGEKDELCNNLYKMVLCLRWNGNISNAIGSVIGVSHVTIYELATPSIWPANVNSRIIPGNHIEVLKIFGPERKINLGKKLIKKAQLENALAFNLMHDHYVEHSFLERRICRVEMKLILRNCMDFPLRVKINTPGIKYLRPAVTRTQLYTPHSSSTFSWSSRSIALIRLTANERYSLALSAAFTSPGTYDLGSRLTVAAAAEGDSQFTVQFCSAESSIIISDKKLPNN